MPKIDTKNSIPATTAVESAKKLAPVDKQHENKFSEMVEKKDKQALVEDKKDNKISPEQLREEIMKSMVQQNIKRSMEKAKEIRDEMKK